MKHENTHKSGLFLMELILAIFIFTLTGAVCLQLFVKSHLLSGQAKELSSAVMLCVSAAEAFRAGFGERETLQKALPELAEAGEDVLEAFYDRDFAVCGKPEAVYCLRIAISEGRSGKSARIVLAETEEERTVYELSCSVHVPS